MPSLLNLISCYLADLIMTRSSTAMSPLYACIWNWTYFSPQCEVSTLPHDLHSFVILLLENKSMAPTISLRDIRPLVAIWYAAGQGWYRAKVLQICCSSLDLFCSKGSDLLCCRTTAFCAALPHTGRASLSQLQLRIFSPLRKLIRPNSGVPTCSRLLQKVPEQSKTKLTLVRPMPFGLGKLGKVYFMVCENEKHGNEWEIIIRCNSTQRKKGTFIYIKASNAHETWKPYKTNCVTQLKLYSFDKLSSPIFCCLSVTQASVSPDQISTFSNIYSIHAKSGG